jgi:hypothetical protein
VSSSLSCCLSAATVCFLAVLFPPRVSAFLTVSLSATGLLRRTVSGRVEPRRGTGISTGPFPWPALRTRRAHY